MSDMKAMAKQSSHYFLAYALSMVAGLISFPIYTRLFKVSEYGLLGLITTAVFLVMAIAKLGIQNSIIRFYDEVRTGKRPIGLREFYSTLTFGPMVIVAAASMIYALVVLFLKGSISSEPRAFTCFILSAVYTFFFCTNIITKNFLRAEHNTGLFNTLNVASKYLSLLLGVTLVYFVFKSLVGLYVAFIITELIAFIYLLHRFTAQQRISVRAYNNSFFKESLAYGFPLMGMEMTNVILNAGNRYVILFYMSTTAVGLFSAGYDLSMSVVEALIFPLSFAITPLYMRIYSEKGLDATSVFLSKCLRYFLMAAIPCMFGLNFLGRELTLLLASTKFMEAYKVIPYVSWGVLFFGLGSIFNAGLLIQKKSMTLTYWTMAAGALNIGLNFLFIPLMGFTGSALATLVTYVSLFVVLARESFKYLPFSIDYRSIVRYVLFSCIMLAALYFQRYDSIVVSLALKTLTGAIVYGMLILGFEEDTRTQVVSFLARRRVANESV